MRPLVGDGALLMKIAHLCPSLSRREGISAAVCSLTRALSRDAGADVAVYSVKDQFTTDDALQRWDAVDLRVFPAKFLRPFFYFRYSPALGHAIGDCSYPLLHAHGLWTYLSVASLRYADRNPRNCFVLSPHGMLDPWAVSASRLKKRIGEALFEKRRFERANCFHALNEPEADAMREYGLAAPICVIPNGVDMPPETCETPPPWHGKIDPEKHVLLFLGRLHRKKGLHLLLEAWAQVKAGATRNDRWQLVISGWDDDNGYDQELLSLAKALGIAEDVHLTGPVFGESKHAAFFHADAFTLPSFSEGLPVAILEAWAYGKPTIQTPFCNLPEGRKAGAAIEVGASADELAGALMQLFSMNADQREAMGNKAKALVEMQYCWAGIARDLADVYRWLLDGGSAPPCVRAE